MSSIWNRQYLEGAVKDIVMTMFVIMCGAALLVGVAVMILWPLKEMLAVAMVIFLTWRAIKKKYGPVTIAGLAFAVLGYGLIQMQVEPPLPIKLMTLFGGMVWFGGVLFTFTPESDHSLGTLFLDL